MLPSTYDKNCISLFYVKDTKEPIACQIEPTLVSENLTYDTYPYQLPFFSASQALSNTDKRNRFANWLGTDESPAHFVYDLGCKILVSKLVLRNSCNGDHKDR